MTQWSNVVVLSGGVGGAKFVDGLAAVLPPEALTAVVNTGDDFVHWGLTICPDLDTVMYTLANLAEPKQGWGVVDESFNAMAMVERYGGPAWFRLGDRDLATHIIRTQALASGASLTEVTGRLCRALGVGPQILPMANAPRATWVQTPDGELSFQDWLVRERGRPLVDSIRFSGRSQPAPEALAALAGAELVLIAPSNPYVSIDPITTLSGVRAALANKLVVAVSPIVAGRAVKGPLAEMIPRLADRAASAAAVADHYGDLLTGFVHETGDNSPPQLRTLATATVMTDRKDRARLARAVLDWAGELQ